MLKNYSDHTISFRIGNQYIEIPPGWSCDLFNDDPELEEFLRQRYPELREPAKESVSVEVREEQSKRGRKKSQ